MAKTILTIFSIALITISATGCNSTVCLDSVQLNATFVRSSEGSSAEFNQFGDFHLEYDRSGFLAIDYDSNSRWDNLFGAGRNVSVEHGLASVNFQIPGSSKDSKGKRSTCTTADDITPTRLQFQYNGISVDAVPDVSATVDSVTLQGATLKLYVTFDLDQPSQPMLHIHLN